MSVEEAPHIQHDRRDEPDQIASGTTFGVWVPSVWFFFAGVCRSPISSW